MALADKISQAFELIFSEGEPQKRRSAIVIFDAPLPDVTMRDRQLRRSARQILASPDEQQSNRNVFEEIIKGYLKEKSASNLHRQAPIRRRLAGSGILPLASVEITASTIKALAKQPNVLAILPNQPVSLISPMQTTEQPMSDGEIQHHMTWGLQRLNIANFWEQAGTRGKGIKIGVIDTGVYGEHTVLKQKVEDFAIIDPLGRRLSLLDGQTFDYHRHGTHICGTIAGGETAEGVAIGVAPDVKLAVAQIHFGERSFLSSVVDGIDWAVSKGADVINMSIGMPYYDDKIDNFFKLLVERDIAPIVAIGNESHGSTSCPGNAKYAFGVGALQKTNANVEVAPFSGGGSLDFPGSDLSRIIKPDVVAPGAEIWSCVPSTGEHSVDDYRFMDGTSMAAPHVAGVVAILMAACKEKSVTEIFDALRETAKHPSGKTRRPDNRWGYGEIEPIAALEALRQ